MAKILIVISFCISTNFLGAQVSVVSSNKEFVNFGIIDLSVSSSWTTTQSITPSKLSNYGSASFKNQGSNFSLTTSTGKWVNGYIKHYATTGNTSHFYPVGSSTSRMFLSTSNEIPNSSISIAWLAGNPSTTPDPTNSNQYHPVTQRTAPILTVSTLGQWDWSGNYSGNVNVSVKVPSTITGGSNSNTNLRLVGWNGSSWINLGTAGSDPFSILYGVVPANIHALGIGNITVVSNFRTIDITEESENVENFFILSPNPLNDDKILNLEYKLQYTGKAQIALMDAGGKTLMKYDTEITEGVNKQTLDCTALASGVYSISITGSKQNILVDSKKIIIK
jgi:hypothetical protein